MPTRRWICWSRASPRAASPPCSSAAAKTSLLIAVPGVLSAGRTRLWLHLLLVLATIGTTTLAGAMLAGVNLARNPAGILIGVPFSLTLMTILTAHELGHYFMGKWHRVQVSLPYFIPVPFSLGTFGAFIQMRSPIRNRRELFDVGFAGPIAGFVVALALLIFGLVLSDALRAFRTFGPPLGDSLLTSLLTNLLRPQETATILSRNPIALAAYFGILLTGINLLPAGQLDGGHIAYALFGRSARPLAVATVVALLYAGRAVLAGVVPVGWPDLLHWPAPCNSAQRRDPHRPRPLADRRGRAGDLRADLHSPAAAHVLSIWESSRQGAKS